MAPLGFTKPYSHPTFWTSGLSSPPVAIHMRDWNCCRPNESPINAIVLFCILEKKRKSCSKRLRTCSNTIQSLYITLHKKKAMWMNQSVKRLEKKLCIPIKEGESIKVRRVATLRLPPVTLKWEIWSAHYSTRPHGWQPLFTFKTRIQWSVPVFNPSPLCKVTNWTKKKKTKCDNWSSKSLDFYLTE